MYPIIQGVQGCTFREHLRLTFLDHFFSFFALNKSKNTALIILIGYVLPIVGLIIAKIIFNDKINGMMYLGMLITLIGLTITIKYKKRLN